LVIYEFEDVVKDGSGLASVFIEKKSCKKDISMLTSPHFKEGGCSTWKKGKKC